MEHGTLQASGDHSCHWSNHQLCHKQLYAETHYVIGSVVWLGTCICTSGVSEHDATRHMHLYLWSVWTWRDWAHAFVPLECLNMTWLGTCICTSGVSEHDMTGHMHLYLWSVWTWRDCTCICTSGVSEHDVTDAFVSLECLKMTWQETCRTGWHNLPSMALMHLTRSRSSTW